MTLRETQVLFARLLPSLITWCFDNGYEVVLGEVQRSDEQAEINALKFEGRTQVVELVKKDFPMLAQKILNNGKNNGIRGSLHELCCAIDLKLFFEGVYLKNTEDYRTAGEYWESLGGTWGGHFNDGGHFSIAYGGKK